MGILGRDGLRQVDSPYPLIINSTLNKRGEAENVSLKMVEGYVRKRCI